MLEKRNKLKKFVVLGIVAMFASLSVIVIQSGNAPSYYGQQSPNLMESSQNTYAEVNSTSLANIAMKAYLEDSAWDNAHNISAKFNYSSELSQVMNQWQEIYPKVLLQGGNPICCLGWNSNYTGMISLNLIAKYIKNNEITSKKSFTIENMNGTSTVVVKTIKKSSVGYGQQSTNWDGYSFYSQGSQPCGWGWFSWTKHFNYAVCGVTEHIVIPSGVNDKNEPGPIASSTSAKRYTVDTYVPVAMSVWDSLSSDSNGCNMVQAGVEVAPNKAPCIWWEHYYPGASYGAMPISIHGYNPQPGDTVCISIDDVGDHGAFTITYNDYSRWSNGGYTDTPSISKFTPYYFGSVVEAPDLGGKISQIPYFNPFSVHDINAFANNKMITGDTAWSNGWYNYYYLQQSSSGGQNLNNGFISGSAGAYTISLRTVNYCIGYQGLPCPTN